MSTNCIRCVYMPRTGIDLLCDRCRTLAAAITRVAELERVLREAETVLRVAGWGLVADELRAALAAQPGQQMKTRDLTVSQNPYNPNEIPTFMPGDKVRDKRDFTRRTFRIVARVAHWDGEMVTLRLVGDDSVEYRVLSHDIIPHLEMVAAAARAALAVAEEKRAV